MIKQYCLVLILFQQALETVIAEYNRKFTGLELYISIVLYTFSVEKENAFVAAANSALTVW